MNKETAKEYLRAGLSPLFIQGEGAKDPADYKKPAFNTWDDLQKKPLTEAELEALYSGKKIRLEIERKKQNKQGKEFIDKGLKVYTDINKSVLGIITGGVSGNLEVIDVDTKHDPTGFLWTKLSKLIEDNLPELYDKLVIGTTQSGGYHIFYRCTSIEKNLKLAKNENKEVLLETRGEGGYVVSPPTNGYNFIQGDYKTIPTITTEDREILFSIAKTFDKTKQKEVYKPKSYENIREKYPNATSLEDFDNRGDILDILRSEGWTEVKKEGDRVFVLRPGETKTSYSGNYHTEKRKLFLFSTSTEFEAEKPYSPSEVYTLLKCSGDWKKAALELGKQGYGKNEYKKPSKDKEVNETSENIKVEIRENALGKEIVIEAKKETPEEAILKLIDDNIKQGLRIYIREGDKEIREYKYKLQAIFKKYFELQENKKFTDRDKDSLLDEIVIFSSYLLPADKDIFKALFLFQDPIKEMGISEEALFETIKKLTTTRDKEAQSIEFKKLLSEATELQAKGQIDKALEKLENKVKEVKLKDKATEFSSLLSPTSEAKIKEEEANRPESLDSGFKIAEDNLLLPAGQISVYAGATNHGKTVLLINTAINVAQNYPDKKFIFFTYEETASAITQYFLNTYIDINLNSSDKANRRLIRDYFKTGSTQYIAKDKIEYFKSKKEEFFKTYIETGRILIKGVDYDSEELNLAIRYLQKAEVNLGGVFIDYFQLLNLPQRIKKNSRQEQLKDICLDLNKTAKDTGLPLILAAQFNREVTNLMRLHPTNIGEAGDIERIVNTLIGLWDMNKKPVLKGITEAETDEINLRLRNRNIKCEGGKNMYLEILKSRELPTGSYDFLDYNGNTGKIKNKVEEEEDDIFTDSPKRNRTYKTTEIDEQSILIEKDETPF